MRTLWTVAAAGLLGACAAVRWGSQPASSAATDRVLRDQGSTTEGLHPPPPPSALDELEPALSTGPARARAKAPPSTPRQLRTAQFYSDLGPDEIDVSSYPVQQRYNYALYKAACSRCHSLARSINAPAASRAWWQFYVFSMRVRGRMDRRPFTAEEINAALDFLEYDNATRRRTREFQEQSDDLERRFDRLLRERLKALQEGRQPPILRR